MNQNISLEFDSKIDELVDVNESFAKGKMLVCYPGLNRNKSNISKEAIEKAVPSAFNCPVVCNYSVEENEIGGHDVEFVEDVEGTIRMVNKTSAIGVVPESASIGFETVERDGEEKEYLATDVLVWKRSPAYYKLKKDKIENQSMEINVNAGEMKDGVFYINDFTFTAFCLLGNNLQPCFEEASLQIFSDSGRSETKKEFEALLEDYKREFSMVRSSDEVDIRSLEEGGIEPMEDKNNELEFEAIDVSEGLSADQTDCAASGDDGSGLSEEAFSACEENNDDECGNGQEEAPLTASAEFVAEEGEQDNDDLAFGLLSRDMWEALAKAAREIELDKWGDSVGYMVDYCLDPKEVYVFNWREGKYYGYGFDMSNDDVIIDTASKKRKKACFVDWEDGAEENSAAFNLKDIVDALHEFKDATESEKHAAEVESVFEKFQDISGAPGYDELRAASSDMSIDDIEEKCFAIRGRMAEVKTSNKFSKQESIRTSVVGNAKNNNDPYHGIFEYFGISANK